MSKIVLLVDISLREQEYNLFSGSGTLNILGKDYIGSGLIVSVSDAQETEEPIPRSMTISLAGADATLRAAALMDDYQAQPVTLSLATVDVDANGLAIATSNRIIFQGFVSHATIEDDHSSGTSTIAYALTTTLADHRGIPQTIYSSSSQAEIDASDTAFDRLPYLVSQEIFWGRRA